MTRTERIGDAARRLHHAKVARAPISPLALDWADLDEETAYAVQRAGWALATGTVAGFKLGYTSAVMRAQMHVDTPNYGALFAGTRVEDAGTIDSAALIHPLVEPEIALLLRDDVVEPPSSRERLIASVDAVMPALEIVDTRYERYEFGAVDNIADNSSAARFVIGAARSPASLGDLRALPATLRVNGRDVSRGVGADAMGDPYDALAWFLTRASHDGLAIRAGSVILTGGLTAAHVANRGDAFRGDFGALGSVSCTFA